MKKITFALVGAAVLSILTPAIVRADVISREMLSKIAQESRDQNNSCAMSASIVQRQDAPPYGQTYAPAPLWKTISAQGGLSISIPWSPYWYVIGKQITWYEYDESEIPPLQYRFGRYQTGEACSLGRQYYVNIYPGQSLDAYFAKKADPSTIGTIVEKFTLNGRAAAVVSGTNPFCDQESLAVQVMKNGKPNTVVFAHQCRDLNTEMLRMAARVK